MSDLTLKKAARSRAATSFAALAAVLALAAGSNQAKAQAADEDAPAAVEAAQEPEAQVESQDGLTEILVTAQRRGENLQRVPITINAITADAALEQGITTTSDLVGATPGLVITPLFGNAQIYIRGVGTQNTTAGDEPSNAVYIDGVYMPDMSSTLFSLNNIERVEVLKGPQGTLFGRNATGGLIQVITRTPSFTPTADFAVSYSSFDTLQFDAYGSAPLGKDVAVDLAFHMRDQGEGWGTNIFNGDDAYIDRDLAVRLKLLWQISPRSELTFALDYVNDRSTKNTSRQALPGTVNLGGTLYSGGWYDLNMNGPAISANRGGGGSVTFEHDLSWAKLVSITSFRRQRFMFDADQDGSPVNQNNGRAIQNTRYLTQELQLQSLPTSAVSWTAGLFFYRHKLDLSLTRYGIALNSQGGFAQVFTDQRTTSYAAYAQATVPVGDLRLTGGLRYTLDRREFEAEQYAPTRGFHTPMDTSEEWPRLTWRAAADYSITDDALLYVSYSRGFKSGIYPNFSPSLSPINPEQLDAVEGGIKTEWFDNHLRFNASVYHYDYKNIQLVVGRAGSSVLLNAGSARIRGLDAEMLARPAPGFTLRGSLNLIDGRYGDFPNAPATLPNPVVDVPPGYTCPATRPTAAGGTLACFTDATGNRTIRSPEVTFNLGANYQARTSFGELTFDVGYYYNDGMYFDVDNRIKQPAYGIVNGQVSLAFNENRYVVRLWTKNLLDKQYYVFANTSIADTYTAAAPRTVGITLEAHY